MNHLNTETTLLEDCPATLIPAGDQVILEKGTSVRVTQALGGSVTVSTEAGLFRIAEENVKALGDAYSKPEAGANVSTEGSLEEKVWAALKGCFDPEIPINIVDLGLIYSLNLVPDDDGRAWVEVQMTLTAQGCGMGPAIAADAKAKIEALPEIKEAQVNIVWDPVWTPHMISEEGRKVLGLD